MCHSMFVEVRGLSVGMRISFHRTCLRDLTQVGRLGDRHVYLLNHFTGPRT